MHVYMALKEMEDIGTLLECGKYMKVVTLMWCLRVWMMYKLICIQFGYVTWMTMIGICATSQLWFNILQNKFRKPPLLLLLLGSQDKELGSQERYCPCRAIRPEGAEPGTHELAMPEPSVDPRAPQEMGQEQELQEQED
jgi:hypothetical protein